MKQTLTKLKSNTGSTLIIALLFMLICVFVGGSVLVAATVNGGRLSGKRDEQQAILNQRSIVSVFVTELMGDNDKFSLSLPITEASGTKTCTIPATAAPLETLIYQTVKNTYDKYQLSKEYDIVNSTTAFTVTDPEGNNVNCQVVCATNYTVYVKFTETPEVQLKISGREAGSAIVFYDVQIIKDGAGK